MSLSAAIVTPDASAAASAKSDTKTSLTQPVTIAERVASKLIESPHYYSNAENTETRINSAEMYGRLSQVHIWAVVELFEKLQAALKKGPSPVEASKGPLTFPDAESKDTDLANEFDPLCKNIRTTARILLAITCSSLYFEHELGFFRALAKHVAILEFQEALIDSCVRSAVALSCKSAKYHAPKPDGKKPMEYMLSCSHSGWVKRSF